MSAPESQEPAWITAFTGAYEKATGGRYRSDVGAIPSRLRGPAPWGQLDLGVEADLRAWWHWIDTRPISTECLLPMPAGDYALNQEHAIVHARVMYPHSDPDDGPWRAGWVPLTGGQDGATVLDTGDPDLPVYQWIMEDPPLGPPIGNGVRSLVEFYTTTLNAGCFELDDDPTHARFLLTDAPLPPGIDPTHPIIRYAPRASA